MNRVVTTLAVLATLHMFPAHRLWGQYSEAYVEQQREADDAYAWAVLIVGGVAATTPFWGPLMVTGDDYSGTAQFVDYPYQDDALGNLVISSTPSAGYHDWSVRAETSYAEDFSRFQRVDAGFQLEGANRIGIDTALNYWHESVTPAGHHDFWTGDANVLFRFAQCEWLQTRVGLGCNWLHEGGNGEYGFNFTYKADVFIRDPLIMSGELDWGTLGHETLFHPRVTLGIHWRRAELFIGCDYFDIGPTQATSMIAGGRIWW